MWQNSEKPDEKSGNYENQQNQRDPAPHSRRERVENRIHERSEIGVERAGADFFAGREFASLARGLRLRLFFVGREFVGHARPIEIASCEKRGRLRRRGAVFR